jgi:acyl-CoA synthetase (NDP forming)
VDPSATEVEGPPAELLAAYGIKVEPSTSATSIDEALAAADALGYPVALKAAGGALRHRIDLGAVRLALADEDDVRAAYRELESAFGAHVLVQSMVPPGVACTIEVVEDPAFGPVVGFGLGGVASELLGDLAWRAAPLTDRAAAALVDEPRAAPLLHGYRGSAPVDREALVDLLLRVGRLADEHPRIRALSLNPVLARPDGITVLHASVEIGAAGTRPDTGPRRLHSA